MISLRTLGVLGLENRLPESFAGCCAGLLDASFFGVELFDVEFLDAGCFCEGFGA